MSGQHVTAMGLIHATIRARAFVAKLGLSPDQTEKLKALPTRPAGRGAEDARSAGAQGRHRLLVRVVDHGVLARRPFYPDALRDSGHIPMIIGNTHDETKAFLGGDPRNFTLTWEELPGRMENELVLDLAPEHIIARYRQLYPNYSPSDVFFAATTAGRSWPGHLIRGRAARPDRRARLDVPAGLRRPDRSEDGRLPQLRHRPGVRHTGRQGLDDRDWVSGPESPRSTERGVRQLRAGGRSSNCAAIPTWEKYTLPRRPTLVVNETSAMVDDPRKEDASCSRWRLHKGRDLAAQRRWASKTPNSRPLPPCWCAVIAEPAGALDVAGKGRLTTRVRHRLDRAEITLTLAGPGLAPQRVRR
ncbi:hypothetical protein ACRAWD_18655 [Caulobacter segnis]